MGARKKKDEVTTVEQGPETAPVKMEKVLLGGDLSSLDPAERVSYYKHVCDSIGVNWLTKPFEYLKLDGKLVLYATKDCTEQLRDVKNISLVPRETKVEDGMYIVIVDASKPTARGDKTDFGTGVVDLTNLKGKFKANAMMKAETKAKRRATLSIAGLGMIDDSEVESIPNAQRVVVDMTTGVIEEKSEQGRDEEKRKLDRNQGVVKNKDGAKEVDASKQQEYVSTYLALDASSEEIQEMLDRYDGFNPWLEIMPISNVFRGVQMIHCDPGLLRWIIKEVVDNQDLVDMCKCTLDMMKQIDLMQKVKRIDPEPKGDCPF